MDFLIWKKSTSPFKNRSIWLVLPFKFCITIKQHCLTKKYQQSTLSLLTTTMKNNGGITIILMKVLKEKKQPQVQACKIIYCICQYSVDVVLVGLIIVVRLGLRLRCSFSCTVEFEQSFPMSHQYNDYHYKYHWYKSSNNDYLYRFFLNGDSGRNYNYPDKR